MASIPTPFAAQLRPGALQAFHDAILEPTGRHLLILVDGLGWDTVSDYRGYMRALKPIVHEGRRETSILPSTTASALTSYFTGASPLEHGVLGYTTLNARGVAISQLHGAPGLHGDTWRGGTTLGTTAMERGRRVAHVGLERYAGSFLTQMLQPKWPFFGYRRNEQIVDAVRRAFSTVSDSGFVYLHLPDLDKAGHHHGPGSDEWVAALEEVDSIVGMLLRRLAADTRITVTSDHGMIRADHTAIHDLASSPLAGHVSAVAGEGRALMVRSTRDPGSVGPFVTRLREWVSDRGAVLDRSGMLTSGVLGPSELNTHHPAVDERLGDAIIFAEGAHQFTDSRFVPPQSLAQRGVHGSATEREMAIPLWETAI